MTDILIRRARISDAQGMIDVFNPIIRAGGTTAIEDEYSLDAQRAFLQAIGPREACHIAFDQKISAIVGFQSHATHEQLPDDIADIATFVRADQKGRGIGRLLSEATFVTAHKDGYSAINATIRADNFGGLAFYTRIGFRDHSVKRAAPLASGRMVDRISKRRLI